MLLFFSSHLLLCVFCLEHLSPLTFIVIIDRFAFIGILNLVFPLTLSSSLSLSLSFCFSFRGLRLLSDYMVFFLVFVKLWCVLVVANWGALPNCSFQDTASRQSCSAKYCALTRLASPGCFHGEWIDVSPLTHVALAACLTQPQGPPGGRGSQMTTALPAKPRQRPLDRGDIICRSGFQGPIKWSKYEHWPKVCKFVCVNSYCLLLVGTCRWGMVSGLVAKSCPTLCNAMDCILPSSSVHGIYQARILEWVAVCFTEYLPHPGSNPVSGIAGCLLHCRLILYKLSHQGRLTNQLISFGCTGSLLLYLGFLWCQEQGLLSCYAVQASHCCDFSSCHTWA